MQSSVNRAVISLASGASFPVNMHALPTDEQLCCTTGSRLVEHVHGLQCWARKPCILGIDEAGRGPVLGPMVYAAAYAPATLDLSKRAFADSKTLTEDKREKLFATICQSDDLGFCAEILSAPLISSCMLGKVRTSLNAIAETSTFKLIRRLLDAGVNITQVYVDTVGDAARYSERLTHEFPMLAFTVCPKADALYPVVSAASIVAKVVRDRALQVAAQAAGVGADELLGTGYPGDPATKAWLKSCVHPVWGFNYPSLIRFSWETCTRLMAESTCLDISWEADEGQDAGVQGKNGAAASHGAQQQRINFAGSKRQGDVVESSGLGRHAFFRVRKLQRLNLPF